MQLIHKKISDYFYYYNQYARICHFFSKISEQLEQIFKKLQRKNCF